MLVERVARAIWEAQPDADECVLLDVEDGKGLAQAAISAILHDHVIVPKEPSEAMLDRFVSRALNVSVHGDGGWTKYGREQYRAMIEAAPNPLPH